MSYIRPPQKDAAPLASAALPEALRHLRNESARWQVGTVGIENDDEPDCAAPQRVLVIARVVADVAELVRRTERRVAA